MPARILRRVLVLPLLLASLVVAGTALEPPQAEAAAAAKLTRAQKVMRGYKVATRQIGDPYRYGAAGPRSFDCSGLVYFSYRKAGFKMPRTSKAQYRHVRKIKKKNLRRGDFVFFHNSGGVYHVAIFVGRKNGRAVILHAPRSGTKVRREFAWTSTFLAGTLRGK